MDLRTSLIGKQLYSQHYLHYNTPAQVDLPISMAWYITCYCYYYYYYYYHYYYHYYY